MSCPKCEPQTKSRRGVWLFTLLLVVGVAAAVDAWYPVAAASKAGNSK